jgi:uncharacterized protein YbaP (TraB family)
VRAGRAPGARAFPGGSASRAARGLALSLLLALPGAAASAGTFLWTVARDGTTVGYLGGTLHVLGPADWPLPEPFDRAFEAADRLVLEVDLRAARSPDFALAALGALGATPGRGLREQLSPGTLRRLEAFARQRGLPMELLSALDAGGLAVTLPVLELGRLGLAGDGVDVHFARRAAAAGMPMAFLETPEAQLRMIARMGQDRPDALVRQTLDDLEDLPESFAALKRAWRSGDRQGIEAQAVTPMRQDFPGVYRLMLADRNDAWIAPLQRFFADGPVELVLVGAAHLVGPDGLLRQLEARGYEVEPLD